MNGITGYYPQFGPNAYSVISGKTHLCRLKFLMQHSCILFGKTICTSKQTDVNKYNY